MEKAGEKLDEQEIENFKNKMLEKYQYESSAYYSTSRVWDDGIIDPVDTRKVLAIGIAISRNKPYSEPHNGVFRM